MTSPTKGALTPERQAWVSVALATFMVGLWVGGTFL